MTALLDRVSAALGLGPAVLRQVHPGELAAPVTAAGLPVMADRAAKDLDGRLVSLFASDERHAAGRFLLHHIWSLPGLKTFLHLVAPLESDRSAFPSIAAAHPAALLRHESKTMIRVPHLVAADLQAEVWDAGIQ